jgi:hypothetical protein
LHVHPIEHIPNGLAVDLIGWISVIVCLAALGLAVRLDQASKERRRRVVVQPAAPTRRLEAGQDWQRVADVAARDLARVPDLLSMQARAAEQIDAAEHAFNRLLAECSLVARASVEPTFTPARQLAPQTAAPAQQPLAA